MKYRPEIDGLRTVAVMPVIFFHAGLDLFSGGFVGVDVFFVISGYLITSILIDDLQKGRFSIARFYERRARRILPALFFVMLCCAPFAWAWMLPSQMEDFGRSVIAVVFFASNILFWQDINYFAPAAEDNPLLHTWSLAVEEQFYIFFPILLLWLWRFGRNPAFYAVLGICIASLLLAELGSRTAPGATFYLLPTRAWELGAGSLCAFVLNRRGPLTNGYLAAAGLVGVLLAATLYDKTTPFPSLYALLPVVGTALIILYAGPSTVVGKLLSLRGMVAIGLISYSAYLWHQPLFAFARIRSLTTPSEPLMIALSLLALGLAYLSWRFVEAPFRRKSGMWLPARRQVFAASLLASLALCIAGGIVVSRDGAVLRADADMMRGLDDRIAINPGLDADCTANFTLSAKCRTSDAPEILLWGDSFAMHLAQGLLASDPDMKLQQHTKSQCAPMLGIALNLPTTGYGKQWASECMEFNDQVLEWLEANDSVTHVVLSSPFSIIFYDLLDREGTAYSPSQERVLTALRETLARIRDTGAEVVLFAPPPGSGYDTEVLVHGWEEWGTDLPIRLNGMFSFAVFDRRQACMFLARDRFGEKPMYYAQGKSHFAFASELDALTQHPLVTTELNMTAVSKLFGYGYIPAPHALYEGTRKLPGGHWLRLDIRTLQSTIRAYSTFALEPDESLGDADEERLVDELHALLEQAAKRRLMSDVPLGVFLSGGLDSSVVLGSLASNGRGGDYSTFTIGFTEKSFDESGYARTVADAFGTRHHLRTLNLEEARNLIPEVLNRLDEPLGDASILPTSLLASFTRENVKVALSGDGGDELFAGYDPFLALKLAERYERIMPKWGHGAARKLVDLLPISNKNMSLDFKLRRGLLGMSYDESVRIPAWMSPLEPDDISDLLQMPVRPEDVYSEAAELWNRDPSKSSIDKALEFFTTFYLQDDILTKADRASMMHSLETRAVFLDNDLVDFCRKLPNRFKLRNGERKYLLKKVARRMLSPSIVDRKKKGFGIPLAHWMKHMPADASTVRVPGLDQRVSDRAWADHRAGKADWRLFLWTWLSLQHTVSSQVKRSAA